jgi:TonB family protein
MKKGIIYLLLIQSIFLKAQHVTEIGDQSQLATFPGGATALMQFIEENLKQPVSPIPPNKFGDKVMLSFKVDSTGNICNVSVVNSIGKDYDNEAIRVLGAMPSWIPPKNRNSSDTLTIYMTFYFNEKSYSELNKANILYEKGAKLLKKNSYQKSIDFFTKSLEIRESNIDCYFNRAYAYFKMDSLNKACLDWNKIKEVDSEANKLYQQKCIK